MSEDKNSNKTNENELGSQEVNTEKEVAKKSSQKSIKAIVGIAVVGILCLGVGFIAGKDIGRTLPTTHKHYSNSKVIATVGNTKITEKQLKQKMDSLFYISGKQKMTDEQIKASEESMIDYLTTTEILYQEGKKEGIKATKEEVESEYKGFMQSMSQEYKIEEVNYLKDLKISKEDIKEGLEKELIATKYMEKASEVTDKEAKNYYDKNKNEFLKVRASHILIKNTDDNGKEVSKEQKKKNKKKAEEILKKAQAGDDFAQLAKKYSQDSSALNGGDLDFFGKGQMVEEFEKEAFSLKVGEVSKDVVETQFGYHIIKKIDEKQDDFDTVKEELKYNLSYEKQSNLIDNLAEKYKVNVKDR